MGSWEVHRLRDGFNGYRNAFTLPNDELAISFHILFELTRALLPCPRRSPPAPLKCTAAARGPWPYRRQRSVDTARRRPLRECSFSATRDWFGRYGLSAPRAHIAEYCTFRRHIWCQPAAVVIHASFADNTYPPSRLPFSPLLLLLYRACRRQRYYCIRYGA